MTYRHDTSRDKVRNARIGRPPNYLGQRSQLKIMSLVAALIVVMILMNRARQPENWRWLWAFDDSARQAATDGKESQRAADAATAQTPVPQPASTWRPEEHGRPQAFRQWPPADRQLTPADRLWRDTWTDLRAKFQVPDRQILRRLLFNSRHGLGLETSDAHQCNMLLKTIERRWQDRTDRLLARVRAPETRLSDADKATCVAAARTDQQRLTRLCTTLRAAVDPRQLTLEQRQQVDDLQSLFDDLDWQAVNDNTPLWRAAEFDAWMRAFERLQAATAPQLIAASHDVSRSQLFTQPQVQRGQIVRLRGLAVAGYRTAAAPNLLGMENYYVLLIRAPSTESGTVRAYVTDLPPGFPAVHAVNQATDVTRLRVDVEVVGYFLKRAVCPTTTGPALTPVVLGQLARWAPPPAVADDAEGPTFAALLIIAPLCAIFAALFAIWVYRRTSRHAGSIKKKLDF